MGTPKPDVTKGVHVNALMGEITEEPELDNLFARIKIKLLRPKPIEAIITKQSAVQSKFKKGSKVLMRATSVTIELKPNKPKRN
jgi:molybdopterin-binding protein